MSEMFELIAGVIAVAGPEATSAGVVLTGGGSQLDGITTLARDILKAPVRVAAPEGNLLGILDDFHGPSSAATLGLFSWVARSMGEIGITEEPQAGLGGRLTAHQEPLLSPARLVAETPLREPRSGAAAENPLWNHPDAAMLRQADGRAVVMAGETRLHG